MSIKTYSILALYSVLFGSTIPASLARQASSSDDLTTPSATQTTRQHHSSAPTLTASKFKYSLNDPFRIFAPPSDPVCCLIPLPTSQPDPHPTEELLSFEEWKERQLALSSAEAKRVDDANGVLAAVVHASDESAALPETTSNILIPVIETSDSPPSRPIGEFVPIQGRFNYASLDCSARVHSSHRSMKSANSILSSKKDRYMLTPCSAKEKFVIVELCDDIRVDTVQLANFEFFSGVFKDITISLGQTDGMALSWETMGVYEAKNVRGVQTFRPFNRPHAFSRFIRVEFRTHYGKEYFCPVSLLRVYGLTQMEEWRMEEWEREWRARMYPAGLTISSEPVRASVVPSILSAEEAAQEDPDEGGIEETMAQKDRHLDTPASVAPSASKTAPITAPDGYGSTDTLEKGESRSHYRPSHDQDASQLAGSNYTKTVASNGAGSSSNSSSNITEAQAHSASHSHTKTNSVKISRSKASVSVSTAPVLKPTHIPAPLPSSSGGESIYRTITNRLDMLERNSSLSLRYVEEQNHSVRQALRRLEEDVGRLKALTGRQQQELQRSMRSVEKRQAEMERRWDSLSEQVNTLVEEVVLEKRLGIAQLCLLTTVLVFMALTRGSRAETHLLGGVRRRVDSGLGLARGLHPRVRAQSKPRAGERTFSWARQERRSTGDTSHQDQVEPPLTPVRPRSPPQLVGTSSGLRGRKLSNTEARSPGGQPPKGVRFPLGLYPFPPPRSGVPSAVRRSHSFSLSNDQLVPSPVVGKRPATGMKRLARTAHLHEVEIEAQRRRRIRAEETSGDNDSDTLDQYPTLRGLAVSARDGPLGSDDLLASDNSNQLSDQHNPAAERKAPPNTGTFGQHSSPANEQPPDNPAEWEDTDEEESGQELVVDEDMPAPRVPRLFSPPTPGTWGARRKGRGFSVDTGTALRMQCA